MSDENVGGLVELPPLPDIGPEGWYTRADMIAYARAALSAHGQPVVDGRTLYDHRTAVDAAVRRAAPALYHALKNLLEAVEERPDGMGIETATLADARQALSAALKGADHE